MDIQLRPCYIWYVYACSRGARFYHIIVHIFLILKTIVFITNILNHLVAVPVQGYVHMHNIKLNHIYIMYVINLFYNIGLYCMEFYLFSKCTCLPLVMQTLV
jgi:hypothetical protein